MVRCLQDKIGLWTQHPEAVSGEGQHLKMSEQLKTFESQKSQRYKRS